MNINLPNTQLLQLNLLLAVLFVFSFSLFLTFLILYIKNNREQLKLRKLRDDFTSMMIHELRSPLSVIKSSSNMIRTENGNLTREQVDEMLLQMEISAGDLLDIVNDLLDVSKIESGKIEIFKHKVKLNEFIENEAAYYQSLAHEKDLRIVAQIDPAVDTVNCDPEKLKQVMNNLLSNAIKFTDNGEIHVSTAKKPTYVQIEVSDTGIGIPDGLKKKLFHKFIQARELPVSREKGTGLGLVIAKGIIETHGGKIWVEDNPPHGSKFIFTLPL